MRTFIVKIDSPDDIVKGSDVERAITRYIQTNDEDAERYGPELAGYRVTVEPVAEVHRV